MISRVQFRSGWQVSIEKVEQHLCHHFLLCNVAKEIVELLGSTPVRAEVEAELVELGVVSADPVVITATPSPVGK